MFRLEIIKWWETRRVNYNVHIIICGMISFLVIWIVTGTNPFFYLNAHITLYVIFLNLIFSINWIRYCLLNIENKLGGNEVFVTRIALYENLLFFTYCFSLFLALLVCIEEKGGKLWLTKFL